MEAEVAIAAAAKASAASAAPFYLEVAVVVVEVVGYSSGCPIAVVIIHGRLCRSRERGSVSHRHSMSVSQSGSYFTVPPRAHPSTESNFGCFSWEPSSLGRRPEVTIVTSRDPLS